MNRRTFISYLLSLFGLGAAAKPAVSTTTAPAVSTTTTGPPIKHGSLWVDEGPTTTSTTTPPGTTTTTTPARLKTYKGCLCGCEVCRPGSDGKVPHPHEARCPCREGPRPPCGGYWDTCNSAWTCAWHYEIGRGFYACDGSEEDARRYRESVGVVCEDGVWRHQACGGCGKCVYMTPEDNGSWRFLRNDP